MKRQLLVFMILLLSHAADAQWTMYASGVYHSHLVGGQHMPDRMRNLGWKAGVTYAAHPRVALSADLAMYHFGERQYHYTNSGEYWSDETKVYLYTSNQSWCLELALQFYILPEVLYLKAGPYFGAMQVQSDSGSYSMISGYPSNSTNITHFNYVYGTGYDHGFLMGSGLHMLREGKLSIDMEVLFRKGEVLSDRTELVKNTTVKDNKYSYTGFTPLLKVGYKFK